ncbi:MAG: oligosaccharide flippase family protein [Bacteroidaceae bacterium]|nr:oligosaccharide flippase family protein [Bacteroidaceae bacterium]
MICLILDKYKESSERSKEAIKGVVLSVIAKMVSVLSSLLIIPLTIDYVNPTQYGIWLTLSSIIGWVTFFDLGLGNGCRNKFAEAKAKGDMELARNYLSTTYFAVSIVVMIVFMIILIGNRFINWASLLHINAGYNDELSKIFIIIAAFFCMNMIASLVCTMLTADQKAGAASLIQGAGQFFSLIAIWILTRISEGSLTNLALYFAGVPCFLTIVVSFFVYSSKKYKEIAPNISYVKLPLIRDIMGLGIQFFIIYLCLILVFQIVNIVISREIGPEAVTEYNIAYKYFYVTFMLMTLIVIPFWSAFTDAYQKKDFIWMKKVIRALEGLWVLSVLAILIMLVLSGWVYRIWIGNEVHVGEELSVVVALYMVVNNLGAIYMNLINGIGTIRIQLIIYFFFAMISWPLMVTFSHIFGLIGIVLVPALALLFQVLFGKIQITKITNQTAKGIWLK